MRNADQHAFTRAVLPLLVLLSGMAALSWQVLWQLKSALALGVSAWGAALTLAVTMGGLCLGSLAMGRALKDKDTYNPLKAYGVLEIIVGIAGLGLVPAFARAEQLDTWAHAAMPGDAGLVYLICIVGILGIPSFCMGATLPVFGLMARQFKTSIAVLYGLNTLGAAAGALLAAFLLIPQLGIQAATSVVAALNIIAGVIAWALSSPAPAREKAEHEKAAPLFSHRLAAMAMCVTGFATFALEVAWFRSLTAAFKSTTSAFAIMVAAVLLALGAGARLVPVLKKMNAPLGALLAVAGVLILLATPVIERFDLMTASYAEQPYLLFIRWFMMTLCFIGTPMMFLGVSLPWMLDDQETSRGWGRLYALNALASVTGALLAAWVLLPHFGFARTAWLTGAMVTMAGIVMTPQKKRLKLGALALAALAVAVMMESGVGSSRVLGWSGLAPLTQMRVLEAQEGPDAAVSAVEINPGQLRLLFVDGFVAAHENSGSVHYMPWMGHLPMLLHPRPEKALVICFGTGQTANAVRREGPKKLDIVDINPRVFGLAHHFTANQKVLEDKRVTPTVMDGRAYIRRTHEKYDVITLEPMPPSFAGVNALYSQEFYQNARQKMTAQGVIAQWVPFHLVAPEFSASIAATFRSVFPNAILWIDPPSKTGILLGSADGRPLGKAWPGFARAVKRDMTRQQTAKAVLLDAAAMKRYAALGRVITDDNQLLAYGRAVYFWHLASDQNRENFDQLDTIVRRKPR